MDADPERFLSDLLARGPSPDAAAALSLFGLTAQDVGVLPMTAPSPASAFAAAVQQVWPDRDPRKVGDLAASDRSAFENEVRTGGSSNEKRRLLRQLGYSWDEIARVFSIQRLVLPLDGVRGLFTVDMGTGAAYDRQGRRAGTYHPITRELTKLPEERVAKDIWDAARFSAAGAWERTEGFFLSTVPNLIFRDLGALERKLYGDDWADRVNVGNKAARDRFRRVYAENQREFARWQERNKELLPARTRYEEGITRHPELIKDPFYFAYETASIVPMVLASAAAGLAAGAVTGGNPLAVVAAAGAVALPREAAAVRDCSHDCAPQKKIENEEANVQPSCPPV